MTWYELSPLVPQWSDSDTVSTTWRSETSPLSEWEDISSRRTPLYDVLGQTLYDSAGELLEAADE